MRDAPVAEGGEVVDGERDARVVVAAHDAHARYVGVAGDQQRRQPGGQPGQLLRAEPAAQQDGRLAPLPQQGAHRGGLLAAGRDGAERHVVAAPGRGGVDLFHEVAVEGLLEFEGDAEQP